MSSSFPDPRALPPPYNTLTTLHPFVDHGWYTNSIQLENIIRTQSIHTMIEIGVWLGKSTMHCARCLPESGCIYGVDHFEGSIEHQPGHDAWHPFLPYLYEQFLSNVIHAHLTHKIIPIRLTSIQAAQSLSSIQPDLIYIDGSHDTESVYQDLLLWYPYVAQQGILCGDDWYWPSVAEAVQAFATERDLQIFAIGNFWQFRY